MKNSIIYILFFVASCSSQKQKEVQVEITKDAKGNVIVVDEFSIQNKIKKGVYKQYRYDGTLEFSVEYKDTVRFGWFYQYYEDGKTLEEKSYWRVKRYGDSYFYHRNGQLETYNAWDAFDNVFFVIKRDSLGNTLREEGMVFSPQFVSSVSAVNIKLNEPLVIGIAVANPPNSTQKIYMGKERETLQKLQIENNTARYKYTFNVSGKYVFVTVGELYDEKGILIQRDSIKTEINVGE
ncbi:MAG: hypothetical protein LBR52_04970 [Prevotellaceae bacterium]|jgi:hypothetical protein|nr:hypothetical protein [Prevotellaceae bacterium]